MLVVVSIAITGTSALFMTKCSHSDSEDKIEQDGTYIPKRDSIINVIDSLDKKIDTLIVYKNKVRIKTDIRFINHIDTVYQLQRDSTLVTEIYKRDTIINLANTIIDTQRNSINSYMSLDTLNRKRLEKLELKQVADARKHRQEVDSLESKIKTSKLKYFGYGVVTGVGIRSLLP